MSHVGFLLDYGQGEKLRERNTIIILFKVKGENRVGFSIDNLFENPQKTSAKRLTRFSSFSSG